MSVTSLLDPEMLDKLAAKIRPLAAPGAKPVLAQPLPAPKVSLSGGQPPTAPDIMADANRAEERPIMGAPKPLSAGSPTLPDVPTPPANTVPSGTGVAPRPGYKMSDAGTSVPTLGTKIKRILGDVAGYGLSAVDPGVAALIPSTPLGKIVAQRHALEGQEAQSQIGLREAQAEEAKARAAAEPAQAEEARARTAAIENPPAKEKPTPATGSTVESGGQAYQWNPQTEKYDIPIGAPKPVTTGEISHTFVDAKGNEVGVKKDGTSVVLGKARPEDEGTWSLAQDAKGNTVMFNSKTAQVRPAPAGIVSPKADNGPGKAFENASATAASKDVETARGGDFRYRSMAGSFPKAQNGDQQAMLNLLTNHIGMTLGMQKGARITKDILNEARQSAPWLQGIQAKFDSNGYLSGVTLTKPQMQQMMDLATQQRANSWAQAIESARQAGVADKLKIPADVRIRVQSPDGKFGTIPGSQLSQAEDNGYVVSPQ